MKLYLVVVIIVTLTGCRVFGGREDAASRRTEQAVTAKLNTSKSQVALDDKQQELTFFDSSIFDDRLSDSLRKSPNEVVVVPAERFGLNQIPPRMQQWLSAVSASGGAVDAVPASTADFRGLPTGLVGLAKELYEVARDAIREKRTYGPASGYDATLVYDDETGIVTRVSFVRSASGNTRSEN